LNGAFRKDVSTHTTGPELYVNVRQLALWDVYPVSNFFIFLELRRRPVEIPTR